MVWGNLTSGGGGGGWGGRYSTKFNTGRLRPEVQPLNLFCTTFDRKGTPFLYLLLTNGTSFAYRVKNATFLLTAVNARGVLPYMGYYRYVPRNRVWFLTFSVLK